MNKMELVTALDKAGVSPDSYWLEGGLPSESYCLEQREDGWAVYYSERGRRRQELLFKNEDEACRELYSRLLKDPTTHITREKN